MGVFSSNKEFTSQYQGFGPLSRIFLIAQPPQACAFAGCISDEIMNNTAELQAPSQFFYFSWHIPRFISNELSSTTTFINTESKSNAEIVPQTVYSSCQHSFTVQFRYGSLIKNFWQMLHCLLSFSGVSGAKDQVLPTESSLVGEDHMGSGWMCES